MVACCSEFRHRDLPSSGRGGRPISVRTANSSGKNVSDERPAQERHARRPAGAALVADDPLDGAQVAEPPGLEGLLDVDQLLARLVDVPLVLRVASRSPRRRRPDRDAARAAASSRGRPDRRESRSPGDARKRRNSSYRLGACSALESCCCTSGSWSKTASIAAFLLPNRNSSSRYCADWKPDALPSTCRNCAYSDGVRVASTDHCSVICRCTCLTLASRFSAGPRSSCGEQAARRAQLVDQQLDPQLGGLVLDDEQHLVVVIRERHLRVQQLVQVQVAGVVQAGEVSFDAVLEPAQVAVDADGVRGGHEHHGIALL